MSYINLLEIVYPIGSLYCSMNATSPSEIIGGTWERIPEWHYLASASFSYPAGYGWGSNAVTLSVNQIPSHYHTHQDINVGWSAGGNGSALCLSSYSQKGSMTSSNYTGGGAIF